MFEGIKTVDRLVEKYDAKVKYLKLQKKFYDIILEVKDKEIDGMDLIYKEEEITNNFSLILLVKNSIISITPEYPLNDKYDIQKIFENCKINYSNDKNEDFKYKFMFNAISSEFNNFNSKKLSVLGYSNTFNKCTIELLSLGPNVQISYDYINLLNKNVVSEIKSVTTINNSFIYKLYNYENKPNLYLVLNNSNINNAYTRNKILFELNKSTIRDYTMDGRLLHRVYNTSEDYNLDEISKEITPNEYIILENKNGKNLIAYNNNYDSKLVKVTKNHNIKLKNMYELLEISDIMKYAFISKEEVMSAFNRGSFKFENNDNKSILNIQINENMFNIKCDFEFNIEEYHKYFSNGYKSSIN